MIYAVLQTLNAKFQNTKKVPQFIVNKALCFLICISFQFMMGQKHESFLQTASNLLM